MRSTGVPSRVLAVLTGGALLAGLITGPAIPAATATAEPPPSATDAVPGLSTTIDGVLCGDEPTWHTGDGNYLVLQWSTTFEVPTAETAVMYAVVNPDGVDVDVTVAPVDDNVATSRDRTLSLDHGKVYTLEVRFRGSDGLWKPEPVASCVFGVRHPPVVSAVVPVLSADAAYVYGEARGGVGVAGQYLVAATREGEPVGYEYAVTGSSTGPTAWQSLAVVDGERPLITVTPAAEGRQYLHLRGIDQYGVRGPTRMNSFLVGTAGTTKPTPPPVTVTEPEDGTPDDGRIPLEVRLTSDLDARPMGEVVLRYGTREVGRTTFDAPSETVSVEQSLVGTGFQTITAEYRQFEGEPKLPTTARICAKDCAYTGGRTAITALGDVRLDPNLRAEVSGFSPKSTHYRYEWLRAGKVVSSGERDEDAYYLSLPPDEGQTLTARVTAYGPRMTPKTVTTSVKIGDRVDADVCAGAKAIGTRWLSNYAYCRTGDNGGTGLVGEPGSGQALEMLVAKPWPGPGYSYSESGEPPADQGYSADYWFDSEGYVQGRGWEGLKRKDDVYYLGSVGENRRLEAFRIDDGGVLAPYYDVWYRAYSPQRGWLGWAKNGENAGATRFGHTIEAIEIRVLPTGKSLESASGNAAYYSAPVQQQVQVRSYLRPSEVWRAPVIGGATAGLTSTNQRMNALRVDVDGTQYSGGVQVAARVEGDGWRSYVANDRVAGTYHATNRTSAYRMRLTDQMAAQYDIYYRTYVAGTGWLGWARNSGRAGTESYAKRVTAVQVLLVKKGDPAPPNAYGRAAYLD
jgi:hypothetical protein